MYSTLLKIFPLALYIHSVSTDFAKQIMPILRISSYNSSLVIWTVISWTTAKFKPLILSMSSFALSYTAKMFILMTLYDFCLLPAQFWYIIIYVGKADSHVQNANHYEPSKFPMEQITFFFFCGNCNFKM
jgi:hypothetical protein